MGRFKTPKPGDSQISSSGPTSIDLPLSGVLVLVLTPLACVLAYFVFLPFISFIVDDGDIFKSSKFWKYGTFVMLVILTILYWGLAFNYTQTYCQFRSTPPSIKNLLTILNHELSSIIDPLADNTNSVCNLMKTKSAPYQSITSDKTPLVNWRPLTVRLTGYLGGINGPRDGVFDMEKGVQLALSQGARAFVFEIDYLEDSPCNPVLIHRDSQGVMRSLHTGSIKEGCKALTDKAFEANYDPVMIIVYFRRVPPGQSQQNRYLQAVAASLNPLSQYHLGSNDKGNFHNCRSESHLFTSEITNFQKKFIVLCNYNTNLIVPPTGNPKDNLDFWTNARIYQDPQGRSSSLGSVTKSVNDGGIAYAQVGSTEQLLNIPSANQEEYRKTSSANTFKIALSDIEYEFSSNNISFLLNTLGIQCVPLDVISLSADPEHQRTIQLAARNAPSLQDLSNAKNPNDPLSFWAYAGWSRKLIIESFENPSPVENAKPIPGFIIPTPIIPKRPPPSTNSNGGLVNIA